VLPPRAATPQQVLEESEEPLIRSEKQQQLVADDRGSGRIGTAAQEPHSPSSFAEVQQGLGVQTLTLQQLASVTAGAAPKQRAGFELFEGMFRGAAVAAWRLTISQPVSSAEVHRAYSRFCAAHPNVCSIMGICIEPLDTAEPMEEDSCCPSPSGRSAATQQQQQPLPDVLEAGCHVWVLEERHGSQNLSARVEQGLLSWQHALTIAQDVGSALACLQALRRICPLAAEGSTDTAAILGENSHALSAPLSPLAVAQMLVLDNVQVNSVATAKLSLVPALLTQLEFALCSAPDAQRVSEISSLLLPYIHPASMFGSSSSQASGQSFDGLYSYGIVLLQLLTERSAPGLLGTVQAAVQQQSLSNLVPRTPAAGAESDALAEEFAALALSCCGSQPALQQQQAPEQQQQPLSLDLQVLPALQQLRVKLEALGTTSMSWEQVEELLMMPLQPSISSSDPTKRRWVRQDFKMRRKMFLEEVAKLATDGPIHKIEVRRSRCFKDSVTTFSGKVGGGALWGLRARAWWARLAWSACGLTKRASHPVPDPSLSPSSAPPCRARTCGGSRSRSPSLGRPAWTAAASRASGSAASALRCAAAAWTCSGLAAPTATSCTSTRCPTRPATSSASTLWAC
jgi:hypothetical protein